MSTKWIFFSFPIAFLMVESYPNSLLSKISSSTSAYLWGQESRDKLHLLCTSRLFLQADRTLILPNLLTLVAPLAPSKPRKGDVVFQSISPGVFEMIFIYKPTFMIHNICSSGI